jgi:N-acetylglucosamine malate deacetylase 2
MHALPWLAGAGPNPSDGSRVAVVVAHPDDETIGCGGSLSSLHGVNVVVVTDGAPRDLANARRAGFDSAPDYARARMQELRSALGLAGIREEQVFAIGVEDGGVWPLHLAITQRLAGLFEERKIELVVTHAFEGGHSDHDGVAYCVHLAAGLLLGRAPAIIEMPFYHQGRSGLTLQTFCDGEEGVVARLSPAQVARKRAMFDRFGTQKHILDRFDPTVERYRLAKAYDFRSPPNLGALRYSGRGASLGLPHWMARCVLAPIVGSTAKAGDRISAQRSKVGSPADLYGAAATG